MARGYVKLNVAVKKLLCCVFTVGLSRHVYPLRLFVCLSLPVPVCYYSESIPSNSQEVQPGHRNVTKHGLTVFAHTGHCGKYFSKVASYGVAVVVYNNSGNIVFNSGFTITVTM